MAEPRQALSIDDDDQEHFSWTPAERESFFAAIERHRRACWRVSAVSVIAVSLATFIVGVLTAPLFYALLILIFDVAGLFSPAVPNLATALVELMDPAMNNPESVALGAWLKIALLAALPGAVWISLVLLGLWRLLRVAANGAADNLDVRAPNPLVLAEQRLANVIDEMAIAASLPRPRVSVARTQVVNAAVVGSDDKHTTIVVSEGLLARLTRAEMQGVAAHLIGTIADGDMRIGQRAALTMRFFSFVSRLATLITSPKGELRALGRIARTALRPTPASAKSALDELAEFFPQHKDSAAPTDANKTTWREYAMMPLAGPLAMTGFFGGVVSMFVLGSLLALTWRQRKYMADASAVRLTRDPETLAGALDKMARAGGGGSLASWAEHMSVSVPLSSRSSLLGLSLVPMFPALHRRLRQLEKLGAAPRPPPPPGMPIERQLLVAALFTVLGVLVAILLPLLIFVSLALSMLFLGLPVAILHALLRLVSPW